MSPIARNLCTHRSIFITISFMTITFPRKGIFHSFPFLPSLILSTIFSMEEVIWRTSSPTQFSNRIRCSGNPSRLCKASCHKDGGDSLVSGWHAVSETALAVIAVAAGSFPIVMEGNGALEMIGCVAVGGASTLAATA